MSWLIVDRQWRQWYRQMRHNNRRNITVLSDTHHKATGMIIRGNMDEKGLEEKLKAVAAKWFPQRQFVYDWGVGYLTITVSDASVDVREVTVPALLKEDRLQKVATLRAGELPFPYYTFIEALPFEVIEVPTEAQDICARFEELVI